MIIVEYCPFGNLQDFLVKHRECFVDQILRDTDVIDPTISFESDSHISNSLDAESCFNSAYISYDCPSPAKADTGNVAVHQIGGDLIRKFWYLLN